MEEDRRGRSILKQKGDLKEAYGMMKNLNKN